MTDADVRRAVAEGFTTPETVKRFTGALMGPCQGRACEELVLAAIARELHVDVDSLPRTTSRPPAFGVRMGILAGGAAVDP